MIAELQRRASEELGSSSDAAVVEYVEMWVEGGKTLVDLAKSISGACAIHVMRQSLAKYVYSLGPEGEIEARLVRARARGAHSMAEDATAIADEATPDDVQVAALRMKARHWLASKWNREELGEQKGQNVQISLNVMHLQALEGRVSTVAAVAPAEATAALPAGQPAPTEDAVDVQVLD